MISWLLAPLNYPFMIRGLIAVVMVGTVCSVVGVYIFLRGMAFFGDALAHAILPGVAVGYLIGNGAREPLFWYALIAAILSALGIGAISRNTKIKEDTAIGIIFAGMFALGITLISTVRSYSVDLAHFLFGDVLGVRNQDLLLSAGFSVFILLSIASFYKEFLVLSFDPILAETLRLPARILDFFLLILIALTIVVSLQAVGVALMVAMLVTPAATAYLISPKLPRMMFIAAAIASLSGVIGLYLSFYFSLASGGVIVLTTTLIFLLVLLGRNLPWRRGKSNPSRERIEQK